MIPPINFRSINFLAGSNVNFKISYNVNSEVNLNKSLSVNSEINLNKFGCYFWQRLGSKFKSKSEFKFNIELPTTQKGRILLRFSVEIHFTDFFIKIIVQNPIF